MIPKLLNLGDKLPRVVDGLNALIKHVASLTSSSPSDAWPVGSVFISTSATNPATLLGFGTWAAFGAGKVLVGLDSGDTDFDTAEETGGAKTVASAGSVAAPTISGSTAAEAAHTHSVTSNVTIADHAAHTHSVTSNVAVADHAAGTTGAHSGAAQKIGTGATSAAPSPHTHSTPALVHSVTNNAVTSGNPSAVLSHTPTNNAVTSGAGASHLHAVGTLAASAPAFTGSASSVVQPYIVVRFWKRTA